MTEIESLRAELDDLHAEHHQACIDRDERLTLDESRKLAFMVDDEHAAAERYRLAWTSARQRASNHLLALQDSDEERDALREALAEEQAVHAKTLANFEDVAAGNLETNTALRSRIAELERLVVEHAQRHNEVRDDLVRMVAAERAERDEARAEVVRLGRGLDDVIADAQHYRHLCDQLLKPTTGDLEFEGQLTIEVAGAGIEASEREL